MRQAILVWAPLFSCFFFNPGWSQQTGPEKKEASAIAEYDLLDPKLKTLKLSHRGGIAALAFSPDGKIIATAGDDVLLWNAATGKQMGRIKGQGFGIKSLCFSPDGGSLATAFYRDDAIRVWDVASGKEAARFSQAWVIDLAFAPAGTLLASRNVKGVTAVWNIATGKQIRQLQDKGGLKGCVGFSVDGKFLASGTDGSRLQVTSLDTEKSLPGFEQCSATFMAFSQNGKSFAWGIYNGGEINIWEIASAQERSRLPALHSSVHSLSWSPDGRLLVTAGTDVLFRAGSVTQLTQSVILRDAFLGSPLIRFVAANTAPSLAIFSPDGKSLAFGLKDQALVIALASTPVGKIRQDHRAFSAEELQEFWETLGSKEAATAYKTIRMLAESPKVAIPLLAKKLEPAASVDSQRLANLLKELDSNDFKQREKAQAEIAQLGLLAQEALKRVLTGAPSAEVRRRATALLEQLDQPLASGAQLQVVRALEILEQIGNEEAREILLRLAGGAPGARATVEAKASLVRLRG